MGDESSSDHNHNHKQSAARRKQVKLACTNYRKAHAACDEVRPCTRCVKYNLEDSCEDKARRKRATGAPKRSFDEVTPAPGVAAGKSETQLAPPAIRRRTSTPDELFTNPLTVASPPLGTGEFEFDPIASPDLVKKENFAQFANAQRFGQDLFETMRPYSGASYGSYMYVQSPSGELMLASSPGGPMPPGMLPQAAAQGRLLQRPGAMDPRFAAAAAAQMQQMQQLQQLQQLGSPNGVPQIPQSPYSYAFLPPAAPLPSTPQGSTGSPATPNSAGWDLASNGAPGDSNSVISAGYPMPYQSPFPTSFPSSPVPTAANYSMPGSGASSPFPMTPNTPNQSSTSSSSTEPPIPDHCGPNAAVAQGGKPPTLEEAQNASATAMALWRMSDRKLVEWNVSFRTLFGYTEEQMKALTCIRLFPSKELSRGVLGVLAQECSRAVVMRSSVHRQLLFSKANGQEFLAEITCTPQFNYAGDFSGHCLMTLSERHALVPPPTLADQQAATSPQPTPATPNIQSLQMAALPMQPQQLQQPQPASASSSPQSGRRNSASQPAGTNGPAGPNVLPVSGTPTTGQGQMVGLAVPQGSGSPPVANPAPM